MPVETGFDLLKWIKKSGSPHGHLPVLLTTAELPQAEHRLKGLSMGAVDYVVRPIELKELVIRSVHAIESYKRIRNLENSLKDTENLALMGRILAASNHEIKNLVSLIKISTDQLNRAYEVGGLSDPTTATSLGALNEATTLLTDVARNMTNLINPQAKDLRKPWQIKSLVQSVVNLMVPKVKPFLLTMRPPTDSAQSSEKPCDFWILAHDVRVKQVLINLILNAQEAILQCDPPEGGKISISWRLGGGNMAEIAVYDNGIGLSQLGVKSEFQPFESTKSLRGGQGLGLWLCANLLRHQGGSLSLSSQGVGKGAVAKICLPTTQPDQEAFIDLNAYLDTADYG
jgi:two-component system CheB/CheR fusion protein